MSFNEQYITLTKEVHQILSKKLQEVEDLSKIAKNPQLNHYKSELESVEKSLKEYQSLIDLSQDPEKLKEIFQQGGDIDENAFTSIMTSYVKDLQTKTKMLDGWKSFFETWMLLEKYNVKPKDSMFL